MSQRCPGCPAREAHLSHLVLGGADALELLLLGSRLVLLDLLLILLLKELALCALLQVGDLLKLDPVLQEADSQVRTVLLALCVCVCARSPSGCSTSGGV